MGALTGFIPAGGLGSRLNPHTHSIPKPMLLMGNANNRLIDASLAVSMSICEHVWISVDYLAQQIAGYVPKHSSVSIIRDTKKVGSAGSLLEHYAMLSYLDESGSTIILPSDHVYENFVVEVFWQHHEAAHADITLLTVDAKSYGEYIKVQDGWVQSIEREQRPGLLSTTGIFIFKNAYLMKWMRRQLSQGWNGQQLNIYKDIVCPAVGDARIAHYYIPEDMGYWDDAGTLERYHRNNMRLSRNQNVISLQAQIAPEARLNRCIVLGETVITGDVELQDAIVSTFNGNLEVTQLEPAITLSALV